VNKTDKEFANVRTSLEQATATHSACGPSGNMHIYDYR